MGGMRTFILRGGKQIEIYLRKRRNKILIFKIIRKILFLKN